MQIELTPARERKLVRKRADQIQRAVTAVHMAVDDLPSTDCLIALNEVLTAKLRQARLADAFSAETGSRA